MSNQKHHELMKNLNRCYDAVLRSSTKGTIAADISKELGMHKTVVHRNLNTLELMGKVVSQHGIWRVKTEEQPRPSEKEIVIELPMPEKHWQRMALLEAMAKDWEGTGVSKKGNVYRIALEKLKETRTIKIKGKNVDDLDLDKMGNLVQQAIEESSKFNFRRILKSLKG